MDLNGLDPARLEIVRFPAPVLRRRALPVEVVDDGVRRLSERMLELMHAAEGIGLAAPQVGVPRRIFVTGSMEDRPETVFINPRIEVVPGELDVDEEGCLSLPGIRADIRRPVAAVIHAIDLEGNEFTLAGEGYPARVWQHEYDHLEGVLIIDKMNPMDRLANRKAVRELERAAGEF